jgi:hypothetical protein
MPLPVETCPMAIVISVLVSVALVFVVLVVLSVLMARGIDPVGTVARWFAPTPTTTPPEVSVDSMGA